MSSETIQIAQAAFVNQDETLEEEAQDRLKQTFEAKCEEFVVLVQKIRQRFHHLMQEQAIKSILNSQDYKAFPYAQTTAGDEKCLEVLTNGLDFLLRELETPSV